MGKPAWKLRRHKPAGRGELGAVRLTCGHAAETDRPLTSNPRRWWCSPCGAFREAA